MILKQIHDPHLSQYAYLIGCPKSGEALIIDALRDTDRYLELAEANDLKITAAAETHIHADFLGGVRQLVEKTGGIRGYLSKEGGEDWQYQWALDHDGVRLLGDGDSFEVGNITITARHYPGHTPEHLCYLIEDAGSEGACYGLVSGDFMFVGDVGRPDLLEEAAGQTGSRESSAEELYESIRKFGALDDSIAILPGHGAGSSCGKSLGAIPFSTVGYEKRTNPSVRKSLRGEKDAFLEEILSGQPAPPMYFERMKNSNRDGVPLYDELPDPPHLQVDELANVLDKRHGELTYIDTRTDRAAFMNRHLAGSIHAPFGPKFSEAVGSYVCADEPVFLVLEEAGQLDDCVRQLVRIGVDRVDGHALADDVFGQSGDKLPFHRIKSIAVSDMDPSNGAVLDVRSCEEFEEGHVPGAINLPHTRLVADADELPDKEMELTVHCGSGMRAAISAAALVRMGYRVVFADGKFSDWAEQADEVAKGGES